MVTDYEKALEDIVGLGCERILTSGMETSALEGTPIIKKCIELVCKETKIQYNNNADSSQRAEYV